MRLVVFAVLVGAVTPVALGGATKLPPTPGESVVVQTGRAPCGLAARAGSVWVGVYAAGTVLRVEGSGRITARVRVGRWACRIALSRRAAWVTRDLAGELVRVDLASRRLERIPVGAGAFDVLLAYGSVWATSFETGAIARIDPVRGRIERVFKAGPKPAGLAACGGRVWVGHGGHATWITSIDPATLEIRRVDVGAEAPGWPACIGGALWVTTPAGVARIDARSGKLLAALRIGQTLADVAPGPDGLVWVTDKQHSVVHRIAPDGRHALDSFRAGPGAFALARAGRSMWVASFAGWDVRRYDVG